MKPSRPFIAAAALVAALAGAAVAGVVAHASSTKTTVTVTEKEYKLTVVGMPAAGVNRFAIKNAGHLAHEFAIAGPGVKTKKTALIQPGKSAVLIVTLTSGKYSIWCPIHAAQGMKSTFHLAATATSGSSGGSSGGGGTNTSTDSGSTWG